VAAVPFAIGSEREKPTKILRLGGSYECRIVSLTSMVVTEM
jgi:hypothetical protein